MLTKPTKIKLIDYHTVASNLVLVTFFIGVAMVFIRGLDEIADLIISGIILSLRYFSFILIRRRFEWGKYLLFILLARNIYRLAIIPTIEGMDKLLFYVIILQIILVVAALVLISKTSQKLLKRS